MTDNPRIAELRRRVEKDPTSIAFAQLAEEYRRSGDVLQAVNVCRDGLARHPGYVSAQVTLGRALMDLGQLREARTELEAVLRVAPDNLAAIRALADMHQELDEIPDVLSEASEAAADVFDTLKINLPELDLPAPDFTAPPVAVLHDPALAPLEQWLAAIVADRAQSR